MTLPMEDASAPLAGSSGLAGPDLSREIAGDSSSLGRLVGVAPKNYSRVLRVEVNGSLHDWFDIEEMGDFVRSPTFADTLLENIARYFGVQVENQAIYDEDGLLTTSADFSRALQRVAPMLYIYDINDMGPELKERTVEELATINAGVEQSWKNFRKLSTRSGQKGEVQESSEAEKPPAAGDDAGEDVLLSANPASPSPAPADGNKQMAQQIGQSGSAPCAIRQTASAGTTSQVVIGLGSGAKFGSLVDAEAAAKPDAVALQANNPSAPATAPDWATQAPHSTPVLWMGSVDASTAVSAQTTARTVFSSGRHEELPSGRSANARPGLASPSRGSQVRTTTSPFLPGHVLPLQLQSRSPLPSAPILTAGAPMMMGNPASLSWPPASSASVPPAMAHWSNLVPAGTSEDLGRMKSGNQLLGQSLSLEPQRPMSPKRPITPPPGSRAVTPPPQTRTQTLSSEARSVTPLSQARLMNAARPPPVSPAQITARSAGLLRMASGSQLPYAPLRSMERSVSPCRAATPPMAPRSVTPTQRSAEEAHAQFLRQAQTLPAQSLRASLHANAFAPSAQFRASTPVRSLGGQAYGAPTVAQPGPGQIALGPLPAGLGFNQEAGSVSSFSSSWLEGKR